MAEKVNFDYTNRLIVVTEVPGSSAGEVDISVQVDIYSDGKEDWMIDADLNKFKFPVRVVGGDELPGDKRLGITYFLEHGWRIRPYEDDHVLNVDGNIYTEEGESPFVSTVGAFNVTVINTVSSLVDAIVTTEQVAEIGELEKLLKNKMITDPNTGLITIYADDDVTPLYTGFLFEDAAGAIPYRGKGAERREKLEPPSDDSSSS